MYAVVAVAAFGVFALFYVVYLRPFTSDSISPYKVPEESKMLQATWNEFIADCGGEVIVENYVRARSTFNRKYENNIVMWTGFFVEARAIGLDGI
jgi:hypothetical protein